ncbi:MAG TPA: CPBP family intramembrane glutamic endopeptidase, partial [Candidatus Saccharimonadales bacterium]|nr:CPBP family intramembrane glutamic endopeptidase [Candidatus Saccharimonadales bacterium]
LRLDERPNIVFSGVLGFLLVLGYLRVLRKPVGSIGLRARNFYKVLLIGIFSLVILNAFLYGVQFYRLYTTGESPRLVFGLIDKETGTMGGLYFSLFYLVGQVFNAFMEESIFRGVILPHLMLRFRFWKANALQALLFGLVHLVFPLHSWVSGQATVGEAAAEAATLLVVTTVAGLVFGYLYYRTASLWTAVFAHLIDNVMGLFFHIQTASSLNAETDIWMLTRIVFFALPILAWAVAQRSNLSTLKPWEVNEN